MKLPWKKKIEEKEERIQKLEEQISSLEEEKKRAEERFDAEQERRKKLSRQKQEAEEKLNKLQDKLEQLESNQETDDRSEEEEVLEFQKPGFEEVYSLLNKLDTLGSEEKDMVTAFSPDKIGQVNDVSGLKNSVSGEQYSQLEKLDDFIGFLGPNIGNWILKMSQFFDSRFELSYGFETDTVLGFIESKKYWVLVSAGETKFYREKNGEYEEVERVKSRVDREHSKGGFSQGRFERKREEQIETHLENVSEVLEEYNDEKVYLLGDERLCKELPGEHLGGFDPNRQKPEQFYQFQLARF